MELHEELGHIGNWCAESGALIHPMKAVLTWFSLNNHIVHTPTLSVSQFRVSIERSHTLKYLRVLSDRCLCFKDHHC